MTKTKMWTSSPLPFQGQKRNFASDFRSILKCYPECTTIVDLFGGSGLLSRIAKDESPDAMVVFNDFDGYSERLANIPNTNTLLAKIRAVVKDLPRKKIIPNDVKQQILELISKEKGFVDYITLSSSLLFSSNYVNNFEELSKQAFYNKIRVSDYALARDYLNNLVVVHEDYRDIFDVYKDDPTVLYLVDPPYLSTDCRTYKTYWSLSDYLDVLRVLKGTNYLYFTSDKSSIIELSEWLGDGKVTANPFAKAKRININEHTHYSSSYQDILLYNVCCARCLKGI